MHPLESTLKSSAIERTRKTGGVAAEAGQLPSHGNTCFTTAASGETSRKH